MTETTETVYAETDEMMTDLRDDKIGKADGVIALQIHDGGGIKVRWRNIFIKEL